MDYYATLGVDAASEDVVISAAYKALMRRYHPDVNKSAEAAQRAQRINEAYAVLSDPTKRAAYDRQRAQAQPGTAGGKAPPSPPPPRPKQPPPKSPPTELESPSNEVRFAVVLVLAIGGIAGIGALSNSPGIEAPGSMMGEDANLGAGVLVEPVAPASDLTNLTTPTAVEDDSVTDERVWKGVQEFDRVFERSGMLGAAAFSRTCFAEAAASKRYRDLDFCLAFDLVAQEVDESASDAFGAERLGYFETLRIRERHREAMREISGNTLLFDTSRFTDVQDRTQEQLRRLLLAKQEARDREAESRTPEAPANVAVGTQVAPVARPFSDPQNESWAVEPANATTD